MVMHARKQPRVHDGYAERKDAHLHQSMQHQPKGYSGIFGDGSPAERSHGPHSDSPGSRQSPRYYNKPPYLERPKEKRGSLSLAETKVNQYLATGSIGQNAPDAHASRDHRDREKQHRQEGNNDNSHHSHEKGSKKDHKDGKERDHRAEVQKSAVRVCGDWSEHISSSGKRYYYNCKTEVSQWEKPKEWHDGGKTPDKSKDGRGPRPVPSSTHPRTGGEERPRHSNSGERHDGRCRPCHTESAGAEKHPQKLSERPKSQSLDAGSSSTVHVSTPGSNSVRSSAIQRSNSTTDTAHAHNHTGHSSHIGSTSHPELKRNNVYGYGSVTSDQAKKRNRHESESSRSLAGHLSHRTEEGHPDDMEISPGSTPTSSRLSSCAGTPQAAAIATLSGATTTSGNSYPHTSPSSAIHTVQNLPTTGASVISNISNTQHTSDLDLNRRAIQTLQELQKALTLHIKAQQSRDSNCVERRAHHESNAQSSATSSGTTSAQLQSQLTHLQHNLTSQLQQQQHQHLQHHGPPQQQTPPHHSSHTAVAALSHLPDVGLGHERERDGNESPLSDMSPRSSCRSPTPSTGSSQSAPTLGTSALSAAALKSQQSVNLTPSLSNYYNEKLIGHVLGWQADQLERQAERLRQEALALGSLHCSRVSVELKRARSLVRIAEIQSTIYEQRIMVLQQQRAEIENLKPHTSLLPS
ncbi:WW domain-containing adapter protein with coiled-coil-like isoform X1 [Pomacea canaliculata]|uniref:WW domain-containing adapter protein with coiled-coil-like isoform X1 n=1 Tax=Pomacea canaliculata TaxID=400727 RepID=UPI000D727390|nr:WW domain-containing adapter protein with coiled-coil-like isoform X1 [Pomacea canaliculata]